MRWRRLGVLIKVSVDMGHRGIVTELLWCGETFNGVGDSGTRRAGECTFDAMIGMGAARQCNVGEMI